MSEGGMMVREIGEELGISGASVCRLLKASPEAKDIDWRLRYGSEEISAIKKYLGY